MFAGNGVSCVPFLDEKTSQDIVTLFTTEATTLLNKLTDALHRYCDAHKNSYKKTKSFFLTFSLFRVAKNF
jgi:hypothetical protein